MSNTNEPGGAYGLTRSDLDREIGDGYSSIGVSTASETYLDIRTAVGGDSSTATNILDSPVGSVDATTAIHETHVALLYLLSNPAEFERAVSNPASGTTTLGQWNAEYGDNDSLITDVESIQAPPSMVGTTPLPYVIFADDAEVVLPQAHTASQLFGIETLMGMELEAAAGVPSLSQLFLRWLALMPGGDHLNLIDPPGLTVMRIAGGRYRVTAAHRVVWEWMNEFAEIKSEHDASNIHQLQVGDLVRMTIVDVFETDNQGKLLSYCPTFDNRSVQKTDRTAHAIRKQTASLKSLLKNSPFANAVAKEVSSLAQQMKQRVGNAVNNYNNQSGETSPQASASVGPYSPGKMNSVVGTSLYLGDDDLERHEV